MTGRQQNSLTLILFSPREPLFRRRVRGSQGVFSRRMSGKRRIFILTGDNALPLTAFALAFSPVDPLFRGTTGRQQNSLRLFCFLPVDPSFVE